MQLTNGSLRFFLLSVLVVLFATSWFIYHQDYKVIRQDNKKNYLIYYNATSLLYSSNFEYLHNSMEMAMLLCSLKPSWIGFHIPFASTRRMWLCCHCQQIFEFFIRRVHDYPSSYWSSVGLSIWSSVDYIIGYPSGSKLALDFISFMQNYKTSSLYN